MAELDATAAQPQHDDWRASLLARRPVVDVRRVEQMGSVADLVFDPHGRQLTGLLLQRPGPEVALVEVARRALGGAFGLTYVPIEQVIALAGDAVTMDSSRASWAHDEPAAPLPRLSKVTGFAVVTIRGQRLGRLVDLLLDADGRRITGYLVEPGGRGVAPQRMADAWSRLVALLDESGPHASATQVPPAGESPPAEHVVPAKMDVRVGRNLVIVADPAPPGAGASSDEWTASQNEGAQESSAARWEPWEADAPTEQMRN
jgi:sporulation protein YlmC with PRC-barrel domain